MDKQELLNRLSDVITFYSNEHQDPPREKDRDEWNKNIEASEIIEKYVEETYPTF